MPNRTLRDWTDSERVDKLSAEAERFFVRLIMKADDFGFFHASPLLLKSALFPYKEKLKLEKVGEWLDECEVQKLVKTYEFEGKKYLQIVNFKQRLRIMTSRFPPMTVTRPSNDGHTSDIRPLEEKRREDEVEDEVEGEGEGNDGRVTVISDNGISYDLKKLSLVLQSQESWLESIARKFDCRIDFAREKIADFILHLETQGVEMKTLKDGQSHYSNWFNKQKENAQRNRKNGKGNGLDPSAILASFKAQYPDHKFST